MYDVSTPVFIHMKYTMSRQVAEKQGTLRMRPMQGTSVFQSIACD